LKDFVTDFYKASTQHQTPDDTFCAFVWTLVVQQPNVRVGLVPSGVTSEVWIAPQQSVKRKAKAKGEELVEELTVELQIIPDAHIMTLEQLQSEYGKDVRLALKPDAIYKAITGSHIRVCAFQTSL
jgi:oxalate---CoA ligase